MKVKNINRQKVGFFRFRQLNGQHLITNDMGEYCFLEPLQFQSYLLGKTEQSFPDQYRELQNKGFIRDMLDFDTLAKKYVSRHSFLAQGTCLHIIVVTLRCDHSCIYCQTGSKSLREKGLDMNISTARKVVDRIFESPNKNITIEFQGGEPLANWDTLKFIIEYAKEKNRSAKKRILISLVSNFTFMTNKRLKFLMNNNVSLCSSLDGPKILHNRNRSFMKGGDSYKNTIKRLKMTQREIKKNHRYKYRVNALTTVTRFSLSYAKEIIDEFTNIGLEGIHLRPVSPFGIKKEVWNKINFSAEDFLNFYKKAVDYILYLNIKGKNFYERTAKIFLTKILTDEDPNFLDIRSPCGAGIGQLAYNFNGKVYACDEGRMLSGIGDESFWLGNVEENSYHKFIHNDVVRSMCSASCLEGIPSCSDCVYKPYCGVCPIYNYAVEGNIFSTVAHNERCKINMGILDYLFEKLRDKQNKDIFFRWLSLKGGFKDV